MRVLKLDDVDMLLEQKCRGYAGCRKKAAGRTSRLEHGMINVMETGKGQDLLCSLDKLGGDIFSQRGDDGGPAGKNVMSIATHKFRGRSRRR